MLRLAALLALALSSTWLVRTAGAAPAKRSPVEKLASEAAAAYKAGDYDVAIDKLERAYDLHPAATLLYNLAKAHDKKGDRENARSYYSRYAQDLDAEPGLRRTAEERLRLLRDKPAANERRAADAGAVAPVEVAQKTAPERPAPVPAPARPPVVDAKSGAFLFHLAKAYERLNQPQKAIDHYTRYIALPETDPKLRAAAEARLSVLRAGGSRAKAADAPANP